MKSCLLLTALCLAAQPLVSAEPPAAAEPRSPRVMLQEALFAEEAERDLEKASAGYTELLAQLDAQRALGATALYRLAEIRARQGKPAEAIALHQRLLAEYPKEEALVKLSRERLAALGAPASAPANEADAMLAVEAEELKRVQGFVRNSPDLLEAPDADGFTPMVKAALNGWIHVVTFLIDHGAAINGHPGDWVPLAGAARGGHKRLVELMLARGADVNANWDGWTALHSASNHNRVEVARVLLQAGAKVDQLAKNVARSGGDAATPLQIAINKGELAMATLLLDHGAEPSRVDPESKTTPLLGAIAKHREDLVKLLLERKAQVDQAGKDGNTPLIASAWEHQTHLAELLLHAGARVDLANDRGFTALHFAAEGDLALVELLLAAGAPVMATTKEEGWTPLHSSLQALTHAVPFEMPLVTRGKIWKALIAKGADINAYDRRGSTPLHLLCAAFAGSNDPQQLLAAMDLLVELGADPALKTRDGQTISTLANDRYDLEKRLLFPKLVKENAISVFTTGVSGGRFVMSEPRKYQPEQKGAPAPTLAAILQKTDVGGDLVRAGNWQIAVQIHRRGPAGEMTELPKVLCTRAKEIIGEAPALQWGDVLLFTMEPTQ